MNIITLTPVRNEEKNIRTFLENASKFSDHIILADQSSSDRTKEIALSFPKVTVIENNEQGHSNLVRWMLLDEVRKIPGTNMLVAIDADEMISPEWFKTVKEKYKDDAAPKAFSFRWIQLWKSTAEYRMDGVWKDTRKTAVWIDDRKSDYERTSVLNDHTSRVPESLTIENVEEYPLLHFQFVTMKQTAYKQAWYRMSEWLAGKKARKINYRYMHSKDSTDVILEKANDAWFQDILLPVFSDSTEDSWHRKEILGLFERYGIEYFEPLDIWYVDELKDIFVKKTGREPKAKVYFWPLVALNRIARFLLK